MQRPTILAAAFILTVSSAADARAAGGTDQLTRAGEQVGASPHWPAGLADLLNDPARTNGWSDWFTEWPNDVEHYEFQVADGDAVNRLLRNFAAVKAPSLRVHLAPAVEPRGLGWVTSLEEGNNTAILLSIGNQQQVDEWYSRLPNDKRFGVMQFEAAPIAVPPTLTIYVGNPAIDLAQLEIPDDIDVSLGHCPRLFHKWNTTHEREQNAEKKSADGSPTKPQDDATRALITKINLFLKLRAQLRDTP